jgi:8-oxo-dGTP diphosphatase
VGHVEVIDRDDDDRVKRHFIVNAFAAEWVSGEATTGPEAPHVMWVDPSSFGPIATTKGLREIVRKAAMMIRAI